MPAIVHKIVNERQSNWEKIFSKYEEMSKFAEDANDDKMLEEFDVEDEGDWIWEPEGFKTTEMSNKQFMRYLNSREKDEDIQTVLTCPGLEKDIDIEDMEDLKDFEQEDECDLEEELMADKNVKSKKKRGRPKKHHDKIVNEIEEKCNQAEKDKLAKRAEIEDKILDGMKIIPNSKAKKVQMKTKTPLKGNQTQNESKMQKSKAANDIQIKTEIKSDDEEEEGEQMEMDVGEVVIPHLICTVCFQKTGLPSVYWDGQAGPFKCVKCLDQALGHVNCQSSKCEACIKLAKVHEKRRNISDLFASGGLVIEDGQIKAIK